MRPLSSHGREILKCLDQGRIVAAFTPTGLWCEYDTRTGNYSHHHTVWVTPFRALVRRGAIEEFDQYPRGDRLYRITDAGRALLRTESPRVAGSEGWHE